MWGNELFQYLYDNLEGAYDAGEKYISQKAQDAYDSTLGAIDWIWEALQGDFNTNQTTGQIAANAALGIIPIVDQILDCRDLIANCRHIHKNRSDVTAWVALCFTLIGLIPSLGSVAKGVLKILFLFVRKAGGNVAAAIRPAMAPIISFLQNEKIRKLFDIPRIDIALRKIAEAIKSIRGEVTATALKGYLDNIADALTDLVSQIRYLAPASVKVWLDESVRLVRAVQESADRMLEPAIAPVQRILSDIEEALGKQADEYSPSYRADVNTRTVHELDPTVAAINPRILTRTQKGLYGEIISDNYMFNQGHRNMLPDARQVRSLEDTPRGRGIDGIYENGNPPPPYIVTETKYRTDSGKYIDSDGIARDNILPTTHGSNGYVSAKQMSDAWIQPRLADEVGRDAADDIMDEGYARWLMIVDESGEVVNITKLDANARSIEEVMR
ncbi:hypothetical protein A1OK_18885 [Enterovibrio norvegicus FF-454]|uniref:Uncharacterized protein n=1 Tax=Enterovibrio norvegicus FF-454 TaxID=1185651 RepID=A0A1E5CE14_9GAMM|nr:hypothetical protein [Enterovibrio norvegicus]OEE63675.1 hypothetical protein A1OK_18885 [Enterovibrio norvegicus FF-454]